MKTPKQEYPLAWPHGWPRTPSPKTSQFKTTLAKALENVETELERFAKDSKIAISGVMISTNFTLTNRNPADSGVAVYFTWDGLPTCIAVDRYTKIEDNLQAVYHCIEAERTKLRHGGLNLVRAAFRGYAALPPPSSAKPWREVLGKNIDSIAAAKNAHKLLAKIHHPDQAGGDAKKMAEINAALDEAKKEFGDE